MWSILETDTSQTTSGRYFDTTYLVDSCEYKSILEGKCFLLLLPPITKLSNNLAFLKSSSERILLQIWLLNRSIFTGLEPVLGLTEKLCNISCLDNFLLTVK